MTSQIPAPGEVVLDHVAHFVPAMAPAAAALERCGFRLTPFTAQVNRVDGETVPSGTGNRCAMLRQGYVELLCATGDETPLAQQLRERLARHVGLHLAAFGSADAAIEHRRLAAAGFPVLPLVDMRRPVTTEAGAAEARFTIARIAPGVTPGVTPGKMPGIMPEGRTQFLTHHTEALVWLPDYLDHPNGARALTGLWIAADDPADPAQRFARFTGRPAMQARDSATIALDRGTLTIATPDFIADMLGLAVPAARPCLAAAVIAVESRARLAASLAAGGVTHHECRSGIAAALPDAAGSAMLFVPAG